jgi:hypothetical protein
MIEAQPVIADLPPQRLPGPEPKKRQHVMDQIWKEVDSGKVTLEQIIARLRKVQMADYACSKDTLLSALREVQKGNRRSSSELES